jgi:hypothetical protein
MSNSSETGPQTTAELLKDDRALVTTLTFIWSGLFLIGVGLYTAVAVWTATHPLGHGS